MHEAAGGLDAADDLDDHVGAGHEAGRVVGQQGGVDARPGPVGAADGDADELQRGPDPGGQVVRLREEEPGHLRADDTTAQQGDPDAIHGGSVSAAPRGRGRWPGVGQRPRRRPGIPRPPHRCGVTAGTRSRKVRPWATAPIAVMLQPLPSRTTLAMIWLLCVPEPVSS